MAYNGGISYEIDQLKNLGVPELTRRQSMDPQLKYALALQEASKMVDAAARERDMAQQMPQPADVIGQMESGLAQRLAPGVQQQGARSMQAMQPQMAQGISAVPASNMGVVGRAQGGIIGYAQGGRPEAGTQSKGPIPQMSPEENAQVLKYLEGLKKFDYYDKNPDKVSPEGRQALEAERRAFEAQFPNSFRQKVNEMMYGPSKGMAMGGEVQGYAPGGQVEVGDIVGGEEIVAIVDGTPMSQADYDRYNRNLELRRNIVNTQGTVSRAVGGDKVVGENAADGSPIYQSDLDRGLSNLRESRAKREQEELAREQSARTDRFGENAKKGISSAYDTLRGLPFIPSAANVLPEQTALTQQAIQGEDVTGGRMIGATGKDLATLPGRFVDYLLGEDFIDELVAGYQGTEPSVASREVPITSGQPMPQNEGVTAGMYDVRNMMPTDPQKLGSMVDRPSAMLKDNMAERAPQESGIRSILKKARPFADKAADIAEILGRGAGASKGFEFAKIGEESRKIESEKRNLAQEKELKAMDITARDAELSRRLTEAAKIAGQELRLDAYNNAVASMRMSKDYMDAVEKLREQYTTGANDYIPFNERFDEEAFNEALLAYEENYVKNKVLAAERIAGVGQEGTTQTPATQRYQVVQ